MRKKHFDKELVITKKDIEDFENSTKCWIYDNDYVDSDIKVRDHSHIIGKFNLKINVKPKRLERYMS